MEKMIAISDTSTMYQLAFGLNIVAGYWLINFFSAREEFWEKFHELSKSHLSSDELASINLYQALVVMFPKFKILNEVLCIAVMLYSIISVLACFAMLVLAAVVPDGKMNAIIFIVASVDLEIANPIGYYFFNHYYKNQLSLYLEVLDRFSKHDFKRVALVAEGLDGNEASNALVKETKKHVRAIKLESYKFHAIAATQKVNDVISYIWKKVFKQ
jgi:hypothetical protein